MRIMRTGFMCFTIAQLLVGLVVLVGRPAHAQGPGASPVGPQPKTWEELTPSNLDPPPIKIEPEVLDFGDMLIGSKASGWFTLTNAGSKTMRILAVIPTCSCTVAAPDKLILAPGESTRMQATLEAGQAIAVHEREVVIRIEGYGRNAAAKVRGSVNDGVRAKLIYDPPDQRRLGRIELESVDGMPFDVVSADGKPPMFLDGFDPETSDPRPKYTLKMDLADYLPHEIPLLYVVELAHATAPVIDLVVENIEWEAPRQLRPWTFTNARVLLKNVEQEGMTEFTVVMQPVTAPSIDLIQDVIVDAEGLGSVVLMGMMPETNTVKLRFRYVPAPGFTGLVNADIRVAAMDHEEKIRLLGRVVSPDELEILGVVSHE